MPADTENAQLLAAILDGDTAGVIVALERGANPNADAGLPLTYAALDGRAHLVCHLLKAGADPVVNDFQALKGAARRGHLPVVKTLLDALPADVHENCLEDSIYEAARYGHTPVVEHLLVLARGRGISLTLPLMHTANEGHIATAVQILGACDDAAAALRELQRRTYISGQILDEIQQGYQKLCARQLTDALDGAVDARDPAGASSQDAGIGL